MARSVSRLISILTVSDVLVDVDVTNRKGLFEQAGVYFEDRHSMGREMVTAKLVARERLGSTGLGHGVAIPHGRINTLKLPAAAVMRLRVPIDFDAPDQVPVGLFIFLFVPEAANQRHLEILSEIAAMLSDRALRDRLRTTDGDAAALHRAIAAWSPSASAV